MRIEKANGERERDSYSGSAGNVDEEGARRKEGEELRVLI